MIWSPNMVKATKAERERIDMLLALLCPCCVIAAYPFREHNECHHIVEGNKRLGHWYTLNLCKGHHRGEFTARQLVTMPVKFRVSISSGKKAFARVFGRERDLWERQQRKLDLPCNWPVSKILPRRVA